MPTDQKTPEVDLKKWGHRILGGPQAPAINTSVIGASDRKPIALRLAGYEIALLYRDKTTPYEFAQELLRRFRALGAPVEGMATLRLSHGKVFKLRSKPGDASFNYLWLPDHYCRAMGLASDEKRSLVP